MYQWQFIALVQIVVDRPVCSSSAYIICSVRISHTCIKTDDNVIADDKETDKVAQLNSLE